MVYLTPPVYPLKWETKAWAIFVLIIYGLLSILLFFLLVIGIFYMMVEGDFSYLYAMIILIFLLMLFIYFSINSIKEIWFSKKVQKRANN